MPFYFCIWNDDNIEHLAEHGVTPDEFEDVVTDPESVRTSKSSGRPLAFGWINGRCLACVYDIIDDSTIYPVTAYEVD